EHGLQVQHAGAERIELADADDRVTWDARLARARRHLRYGLAGKALRIELAFAGDDRSRPEHPRVETDRVQHEWGAGRELRAERCPQPTGEPAGCAAHWNAAGVARKP